MKHDMELVEFTYSSIYLFTYVLDFSDISTDILKQRRIFLEGLKA